MLKLETGSNIGSDTLTSGQNHWPGNPVPSLSQLQQTWLLHHFSHLMAILQKLNSQIVKLFAYFSFWALSQSLCFWFAIELTETKLHSRVSSSESVEAMFVYAIYCSCNMRRCTRDLLSNIVGQQSCVIKSYVWHQCKNITNHFSGPDRALGQMCVYTCPDGFLGCRFKFTRGKCTLFS